MKFEWQLEVVLRYNWLVFVSFIFIEFFRMGRGIMGGWVGPKISYFLRFLVLVVIIFRRYTDRCESNHDQCNNGQWGNSRTDTKSLLNPSHTIDFQFPLSLSSSLAKNHLTNHPPRRCVRGLNGHHTLDCLAPVPRAEGTRQGHYRH